LSLEEPATRQDFGIFIIVITIFFLCNFFIFSFFHFFYLIE